MTCELEVWAHPIQLFQQFLREAGPEFKDVYDWGFQKLVIEHSFHFKRSAEKDSFSDTSVMKQLIHPSISSEISWLEVRTMIKASVLFQW